MTANPKTLLPSPQYHPQLFNPFSFLEVAPSWPVHVRAKLTMLLLCFQNVTLNFYILFLFSFGGGVGQAPISPLAVGANLKKCFCSLQNITLHLHSLFSFMEAGGGVVGWTGPYLVSRCESQP